MFHVKHHSFAWIFLFHVKHQMFHVNIKKCFT